MPPDTQWSGNPNYLVGDLKYDDATTTYDAAVPYDGAIMANLIPIYTPNNTLWTTPNPL